MPIKAISMSPRELVRAKFQDTLAVVQGYIQEAKGDIDVNQNYSANAVYRRMIAIKEALENDITALSEDVVLDD